MKKFLILTLFLLTAIALQFVWLHSFRWTPEFVFATVVALTIFVNFHEIVALIFLAAFILNWHYWPTVDLIAFLLIPLFIFILRRISPWNNWAGTALFALLGISVFYAVAGVPRDVLGSAFFIINTILSSLLSVGIVYLMGLVGLRSERRLFAR